MKLMTSVAALALAAAFATNASAADLGGDCCADLEERVAELEATTARKGNRKVSLEVYGQVTTAVMWWDNGNESNVYVVDPQTSNTRFGLRGKAAINSDLEAGYQLELAWQMADATKVTADSDKGEDVPEFRQAHWYIASKTWGKVRVGFADTANSGIAEIDLSNASLADGMSSSQAGSAIMSAMFTNGMFFENFEFNRKNVVRYDTPTIGGFTFTAAAGEDDIWDVALRYAGEHGGFKIAGGIAYGQDTDGISEERRDILNGGGSIMHMPTGLFVTANGGRRDYDVAGGQDTFWFVSGGLERKWFAPGKTTLFGMGGKEKAADDDSAAFWGLGAVQSIDAAAMDLYISYRRYDLSGDLRDPSLDEFDTVVAGARIKF